MYIFNFVAPNGAQSFCGVTIVHRKAGTTVKLTELPGNPGMSITNCFEVLATTLRKEYNLDPFQTVWIEHYLERDGFPETFDAVHLGWEHRRGSMVARHPRWKRISLETVVNLMEAQ